MCTEMLCLRFFVVVLVCVFSARALDTWCTDHDSMLAQEKTVILHKISDHSAASFPLRLVWSRRCGPSLTWSGRRWPRAPGYRWSSSTAGACPLVWVSLVTASWLLGATILPQMRALGTLPVSRLKVSNLWRGTLRLSRRTTFASSEPDSPASLSTPTFLPESWRWTRSRAYTQWASRLTSQAFQTDCLVICRECGPVSRTFCCSPSTAGHGSRLQIGIVGAGAQERNTGKKALTVRALEQREFHTPSSWSLPCSFSMWSGPVGHPGRALHASQAHAGSQPAAWWSYTTLRRFSITDRRQSPLPFSPRFSGGSPC